MVERAARRTRPAWPRVATLLLLLLVMLVGRLLTLPLLLVHQP